MSQSRSSLADEHAGGDLAARHSSSSWRTTTQLFPTIHLTKEEQIHYDVTVGRVLERTLKEYESFNGQVNKDNWALVRKRKQMSIYRNLQGIGNPRVTLMMGTGLIAGTVEEVMDGLYCDTTDDLRAVKMLVKYKLLDGGVFHVCESRTPEAPYRFAGIKWFAAKTLFGGAVVKSRDLLLYERMGATTDSNGNEIAYHILQSINRPEWPADCIKNVRRAYTSSCYLYRRRNNVVECFLWGEFYANGLVAQRLADYGVAGIWMNVIRSPQCAEAKKLTQLMARATSGTISVSGACDNCHQRPGYFDKLRSCAGCRQRICKGCASHRKIFKLDWHTKKILTEQFCMLCVTEVTNRPVAVHNGADHSLASTSESNYDNQHHHTEYEGNERLSKQVRRPSQHQHQHRGTGLSSTFTQSTLVGRSSQLHMRPTIQEEHGEPFALTEANLRSFELGMSMNGEGLGDVHLDVNADIEEPHKVVGPEDLSTTETEEPILMERFDTHHHVDRYVGVETFTSSHSLSPQPRPSRASV